MNIIKGRIVIRLLLLKFLIVFIYSCGPDPAVLIVQNGKMKVCPSKTVKQMVDEVMESPVWESFIAHDNRKYVNIYGDITSNNENVNAWLQFLVKHDPLDFESIDETFKFHALEYDDNTKSTLDLMELPTSLTFPSIKLA